MGIGEKDGLEIYVDDEKIVLRKYEPACVFCGSAKEVQHYKSKNVCLACVQAMAQNVG